MRRRDLIKVTGLAAAWPLAARAQQAPAVPVIGLLLPLSLSAAARNIEAFRSGLHDLGYFEGRNYTLEFRFADGFFERLPKLAVELVALKPALIIAGSPPATVAVHKATQTIPIVMNMSQDPVGLGVAASLSRPGSNVTGFWWGDEHLVGKQLELLTKAVPGITRIGFFDIPNDPTFGSILKSLPATSAALGLETQVINVRGPSDLDSAFATAKRENLQALLIGTGPFFATVPKSPLLPQKRSCRPYMASANSCLLVGLCRTEQILPIYIERWPDWLTRYSKEPAQPTCRLSDQTSLSCS